MVDAVGQFHHAFANDTVAGLEALDAFADLDHLADPLVSRRYRIADRNDVAAVQQFVVGVTDSDLPHTDEHFRRFELGLGDVLDDRLVGLLENQRLHGSLPMLRSQRVRTTRFERSIPKAKYSGQAGRR